MSTSGATKNRLSFTCKVQEFWQSCRAGMDKTTTNGIFQFSCVPLSCLKPGSNTSREHLLVLLGLGCFDCQEQGEHKSPQLLSHTPLHVAHTQKVSFFKLHFLFIYSANLSLRYLFLWYSYSLVEAHYVVTSYNIQYIFSPEDCTSCHSGFLIYCVSCCWHLWNSVEPCRGISISCFLSPLSYCITIICQRWAGVKEMEHLKWLTLLSRYPSIFAECLHTSGVRMWLSWIRCTGSL